MGAGKLALAGGLFFIAVISYQVFDTQSIPEIAAPPPEPTPWVIQVRGPVTDIVAQVVSEVNNTRISHGNQPLYRSSALEEMALKYAELVEVSGSVPLALAHDILSEKEKAKILYKHIEKHSEMYILPNEGESYLAELLGSITFSRTKPGVMEIAHIFDMSESHATQLYHPEAHHIGWAILDNGNGMYFIVVYLTVG